MAKILIGLSTGEHIRKADFLPYFLGLEKPVGSVMTTVHGQSPAKARNIIIDQALKNDCTHVFFCDDDMALAPDTLTRLMKHDVDVVTGLYLMRPFPHFPVAFDQKFDNGFNKYLYLTPDKQGLIEITNCGLGCVLIKTDVFKKLSPPWVRLGEIEKDGWCDDIGFFNRVTEAGFKMYCDLDVPVGHMNSLILWPTKTPQGWFTEYKSEQGNVLVPQTIPSLEDEARSIAAMKKG